MTLIPEENKDENMCIHKSFKIKQLLKGKQGIVRIVLILCLLVLGYLLLCLLKFNVESEQEQNINNDKNVVNVNVAKGCYKYRIFVFAYARHEGLKKTLDSLLNSDYSKACVNSIDLEIFVDYMRKGTPQMKRAQKGILQLLQTVSWPHGRYKVHQRYINVGLRFSIMEAWQPMSDLEIAAFFEDDVVVSPYWFSWLHDALCRYVPIGPNNKIEEIDPRFIGFSLYRPIHDELSSRFVPVDNGYAPFLLQQPCSWGEAYLPKPWREFRQFFEQGKNKDYLVNIGNLQPNPTSNSWPHLTSWKKYLIYFMYSRGLYVMYPNFPDRLCLSTSCFLKGEHPVPDLKNYLLPVLQKKDLMRRNVGMSLKKFPHMNKMKVFNIMFKEVSSVDDLLPK